MTPSITWEPPSIPRKPAGTSTLLDCLWPQENRNVVALTWALLKEAADLPAHFSDREAEPEQPQGLRLGPAAFGWGEVWSTALGCPISQLSCWQSPQSLPDGLFASGHAFSKRARREQGVQAFWGIGSQRKSNSFPFQNGRPHSCLLPCVPRPPQSQPLRFEQD